VNSPTTDRGRATRDRIIDTACELFYRQGVRARGLNQIATESATGKGQLYHYFQDKSELVKAVVDRQLQQVLEGQEPELSSIADVDTFRSWIDSLIDGYPAGGPYRCPLGSLVVELSNDADLQPILRDAMRSWQERIALALTRLAGKRKIDAAGLAERILAAYQGGVLLAQAYGSLDPLRNALGAIVADVRR